MRARQLLPKMNEGVNVVVSGWMTCQSAQYGLLRYCAVISRFTNSDQVTIAPELLRGSSRHQAVPDGLQCSSHLPFSHASSSRFHECERDRFPGSLL